MDLETFKEFLTYAARSRSLFVAGFCWAIYDWFITLGQEIDLVWNRPRALTSKLLFAFTRYTGLAILTVNMIVTINGGWSHDFCHAYMYTLGLLGTAHTFAVQGALLLRLYVIYEKSMKILIVNTFLWVCQLVAMITITAVNINGYTAIPGPFGCWSTAVNPKLGTAIWWTSLSFETYLCALVLVPAFKHWKSSKRTAGAKILSILIRDSFIWYFSMAACLLVNALAGTTNTPKLVVIGVPSLSIISTVGGSRLLLNVRAVYFSSIRNPSHPGHSDWLDTEGTGVGGKRDDDDGECGASITMGVWSNEDVQRNQPPSPDPPVIMLQPAPPGRKQFLRPPPRPALFGPASGQGGAASGSGLSMRPEEDGDEVAQRSMVSSSTIGAGIQRTEDPDIELRTFSKG